MSTRDAPPRKKPRNDAISLQRQQLAFLSANPAKDHTGGSVKTDRVDTLSAPPEFVNNVQGSSAGAGSGEFHVYKASRRREFDRLALMDAENAREKEETAFALRKERLRREDDEKTEKNRLKREKARVVKQKAIQAEKERKAAKNANAAATASTSATSAASTTTAGKGVESAADEQLPATKD